uniref:Uncharacterized protein n=1 Tax=Meloidogyne enterolobii TaxID=390850 RepID=A0A6V7VQD1_MELEN|nr:unnamed protein product [Meloidogyne enterolobii]
MHPEILRIDEMQTNMRIECYIKYLNDKINSNNAEMRINISLLIQQLIIFRKYGI